MSVKMLIDSAHAEETRVVVIDGSRIEDFDYETTSRKQNKGNIYLAKVVRVEPSLQAAFVDYGGNRHGFLPFSEIHPDYYQIPFADRQALLQEQRETADFSEDDLESRSGFDEGSILELEVPEDGSLFPVESMDTLSLGQSLDLADSLPREESVDDEHQSIPLLQTSDFISLSEVISDQFPSSPEEQTKEQILPENELIQDLAFRESFPLERKGESGVGANGRVLCKPLARRVYKIQEVIKRRQVILVQVVKEERGNKGAALTTYLSLAGRYCVLMPNTARGGGISRKISDSADRLRLKEIVREIDIPDGMGLIVRTAGAQRTKIEIKADCDYLTRLWESIRDLTLMSTAPHLVYEEGSLIKRTLRDLYARNVDEIIVDGEQGYREAQDFMQMFMPSHLSCVKLYSDKFPLFSKFQIENQMDALFSPVVTLPSGGYIVINQTEALVAIDINSGRATREHTIEDTALKTNLEAADEIARQVRLRDLAGLIVIDFIDMEQIHNNRLVERRIREVLRFDRARIQIGRISHFGLLEMSRQRLRPGMLEGATVRCPHCDGQGSVRSVASSALAVLRSIEEYLVSHRVRTQLLVTCERGVACFILNEKRQHVLSLEQKHNIMIFVRYSDEIKGSQSVIDHASDRSPMTSHGNKVSSRFADVSSGEEESVNESLSPGEGSRQSQKYDGGEPKKRRRRRRNRRAGSTQEKVLPEAGGESSFSLFSPTLSNFENGEAAQGSQDGESVSISLENNDKEHGISTPRRGRSRRSRLRGRRRNEENSLSDSEKKPDLSLQEQHVPVSGFEEVSISLPLAAAPEMIIFPDHSTSSALLGFSEPSSLLLKPEDFSPPPSLMSSETPSVSAEENEAAFVPPPVETQPPAPRFGWWRRK